MSPLATFVQRCADALHRYLVARRGHSPVNRPDARHHLTRREQPRAAALTAMMCRERLEREQAAVMVTLSRAARNRSTAYIPLRPRSRFATALRTASSSLAEASHTARARARKTIEQHKRTHPAAGPRHSTRTPGATAEHHDLAQEISKRFKAELAGYASRRARGENSIFTNPREAWV